MLAMLDSRAICLRSAWPHVRTFPAKTDKTRTSATGCGHVTEHRVRVTFPYENGRHLFDNGPNFKIQRAMETGEQTQCVPEASLGVLDT